MSEVDADLALPGTQPDTSEERNATDAENVKGENPEAGSPDLGSAPESSERRTDNEGSSLAPSDASGKKTDRQDSKTTDDISAIISQLDQQAAESSITKNNAKRWAKAHWFATQEAQRMRTGGPPARVESDGEDSQKRGGYKAAAQPQLPALKVMQQASFMGTKAFSNLSTYMFATNSSKKLIETNPDGPTAQETINKMSGEKGFAGAVGLAARRSLTPADEIETSGSAMQHAKSVPAMSAMRMDTMSTVKSNNSHATKVAPAPVDDNNEEDALVDYANRHKKEADLQLLEKWMNSGPYLYCTYLFTVYILFAEDIYLLVDPDPSHDVGMYSVSSICFFFFFLDLCLRTTFEHNYGPKSMYFWLDLVAVVSLLPALIFVINSDIYERASFLSGLRSGRAATSGSRIARFVRVLKLAQNVTTLSQSFRNIKNMKAMHNQAITDMAQKIDFHIAAHVIVSIAAMLVITAGLQFLEPSNCLHNLPREVRTMVSFPAVSDAAKVEAIRTHVLPKFLDQLEESGTPLVYLQLGGYVIFGGPEDHQKLREFPKQYMDIELEDLDVGDGKGYIEVEDKAPSVTSAKSNLILVTSVIFVLSAMAFLLTARVRKELLRPIERIINSMEEITENPLKGNLNKLKRRKSVSDVVPVEHTIKKVHKLLQLGFGEAGAKIITQNLQNGTMNTAISGQLIQGIFGFCDIRNFTDCTEVLKADIVKLVNVTAKVVHDAVVDNHGAPNKNIGDAFLMIWKPKGNMSIEKVVDSSLCSYIRMIIEIARCQPLEKFTKRREIQDRMPGYRLKMGFGLHYGWAVEGAIGSNHKIDASYLSPHVNLASRLEAATKQYGAQILISEDAVLLMSEYAQKQVRLVDRVTVKGSNKPLELYTYDVPDLMCVGGTILDDISTDVESTTEDFFKKFPPTTDAQFRQIWDRAVHCYIGGSGGMKSNWKAAKSLLLSLQKTHPDDGPTKVLLRVMDEMADPEGNAPDTWRGYRALTDK